jgi:hypothetical protein
MVLLSALGCFRGYRKDILTVVLKREFEAISKEENSHINITYSRSSFSARQINNVRGDSSIRPLHVQRNYPPVLDSLPLQYVFIILDFFFYRSMNKSYARDNRLINLEVPLNRRLQSNEPG